VAISIIFQQGIGWTYSASNVKFAAFESVCEDAVRKEFFGHEVLRQISSANDISCAIVEVAEAEISLGTKNGHWRAREHRIVARRIRGAVHAIGE
jgi:hypothetical protein